MVILFGGYELGSTLTSKDRMINKFQTALVNNDAKTVASLLSSDDPKAKIDENSVKGLLDYFKKNPNKISDVIQDLKTESNLYDRSGDLAPQDITGMAGSLLNQNLIKLEKDGRILFFDRYKININTIYLTLQTNYKNTNLYVDGKEVATSNSQDYQTTVGPFLPGIHEASADLKTNFVDLKTKQEVDAVTSGNQQSVDLSLNGQNVALDFGQNGQNLNLNGKLYIDGKDVGVNPFKTSTIGPVLTDGSMKLSVEADMPWGNVKTNEVPINDTTISVNLVDDSVKNAVMNQIMKFINEVQQSYTTDNTSKMTTATNNEKTYVQNTDDLLVSSNQLYKGTFKSMKFDMNGFNTQYDSTNGVWKITENAEGDFNESYYYYGGTPNLQDKTHDFQFTLSYDPNLKNWLVDDWTNNTGLDTSNFKLVTVAKPIQYATNSAPTVVPSSTSSSSSNVPDYVQSTMDSYENGLVNAINDNNFNEVSSYMLSGSPLYTAQQQLVSKLGNAGTKEQLVNYQITNYQTNGDGTSKITTHEQVQITYSNGKSVTKDFDWVYTGQFDSNNSFVLTNIS